ncbi:hypothetical protein CN692_23625 [Bacillus sp. AFS002410]|uniref:hypothetical protein n=1 Tax=Bacillus sp. AFS002410 TaxID=2033481 RepID=UPI000BF1CD54|nr:hypothetical protein [Bacillus sp. AFS002410]PEJ48451.1 hypothetical protein CN692_23625 [Bacillus sp. AFS002410]
MNLLLLEPDVAGGIDQNTIFSQNQSGDASEVLYLHYEFEGWLGDEILETTPCFIITENLTNSILQSNLSGIKIENVEVSVTEEFCEWHPGLVLPKFNRLIPNGKITIEGNKYSSWSGDDFSVSQKHHLVV